jgi:hypothetical protein
MESVIGLRAGAQSVYDIDWQEIEIRKIGKELDNGLQMSRSVPYWDPVGV